VEQIIEKAFATEDKEKILDEIMKSYGQEVLQLVYSYVKDRVTAEDLVQEIFVKCYSHLHTYNRKSMVKTWLWRIAINHCKDYLKSWYNRKVIVSENETASNIDGGKSVEETVISEEEDLQLVSATMNLPVKYREVIYLYYFEEMTIKEVSQVTNQNLNTVKTRLKRAKEILKEQLGGIV
jgi:RNA polymerase sigma-70 factor, ECF subfamily